MEEHAQSEAATVSRVIFTEGTKIMSAIRTGLPTIRMSQEVTDARALLLNGYSTKLAALTEPDALDSGTARNIVKATQSVIADGVKAEGNARIAVGVAAEIIVGTGQASGKELAAQLSISEGYVSQCRKAGKLIIANLVPSSVTVTELFAGTTTRAKDLTEVLKATDVSIKDRQKIVADLCKAALAEKNAPKAKAVTSAPEQEAAPSDGASEQTSGMPTATGGAQVPDVDVSRGEHVRRVMDAARFIAEQGGVGVLTDTMRENLTVAVLALSAALDAHDAGDPSNA